MDPLDFLDIANKLKSSPEESERRTSVSRAYYGLFNHVAAIFRTNSILIPRDASGHAKVVRYLRNCEVEKAESVGSSIDDLRGERNNADYKMELTRFNANTCNLLHLKAIEALEALRTIKVKDIIAGVRRYLAKIGELPSS
ncbi:MAG: hypothetical protein E3J82_01265 [Candidatus Thorarchaeota archaeon]|nr:MAG: hypothetical protein E3J82_01265 [Candidatus Thorarchaeota archaeon]